MCSSCTCLRVERERNPLAKRDARAVAAETAGFSSYLDSTMGHHRDVSRAVISWLSPWRQSLRNGCVLVTRFLAEKYARDYGFGSENFPTPFVIRLLLFREDCFEGFRPSQTDIDIKWNILKNYFTLYVLQNSFVYCPCKIISWVLFRMQWEFKNEHTLRR